MPPRDTLEVDVLFGGAGPAGLAGAIRLRQLAAAAGRAIAVMVMEQGGDNTWVPPQGGEGPVYTNC